MVNRVSSYFPKGGHSARISRDGQDVIIAIIKINKNAGLKPMPNSLDVRATAWEGLCCMDIGFRHMIPPWLCAIMT